MRYNLSILILIISLITNNTNYAENDKKTLQNKEEYISNNLRKKICSINDFIKKVDKNNYERIKQFYSKLDYEQFNIVKRIKSFYYHRSLATSFLQIILLPLWFLFYLANSDVPIPKDACCRLIFGEDFKINTIDKNKFEQFCNEKLDAILKNF